MAAISSGTVPVPESRLGCPAPLDPMLKKELARLDDQALLDIVRLSPQASERRAAACELLVTRHQGLVRSCVRPYLRSPEPAEDLMQVGYIGLPRARLPPLASARPGGHLSRHALNGPDTVHPAATPWRRAVTTVRSESKCFLPLVSKAQARYRRRFR
jgi:hypothetical protein